MSEDPIKDLEIALSAQIQKALKKASKKISRDAREMLPISTGSLKRSIMSDNITSVPCSYCNGKGKIIHKHHRSKKKSKRKCPVCHGCGNVIRFSIPKDTQYARMIEYGGYRG